MMEGICYKGCPPCEAVFPKARTWRLLTKGYKLPADSLASHLEHVLQTLVGYNADMAMAAPTVGDEATAPIPHYFSVTTEEQPDDKWLPFVVSNYARDGPAFASKGAKGADGDWSLHRQLVASCSAPTFWP